MNSTGNKTERSKHFSLEKWFLDLVTNDGQVFIFYAAKMRWHQVIVPYKSMINYSPTSGKKHRSRFYKIHFPEKNDKMISWKDSTLRVKGDWRANSIPLQAELYSSPEGSLQWNCFQPSSIVKLKFNNTELNGRGYVEQLLMTVEPWKIPMNKLRWGRFVSDNDYLVWIEIKSDDLKQWVWYNGEKIDHVGITENEITLLSKNIQLRLNNRKVIESERKINQVVKKLLRYIPGFNRLIPLNFLSSEQYKWISNGILYKDGLPASEGWTIHELVDFKK